MVDYMTRQLHETLSQATGPEKLMVRLPRPSEEELSILNQAIKGKWYSQDSLNQLFRKVCEGAKARFGFTVSIQEYPA